MKQLAVAVMSICLLCSFAQSKSSSGGMGAFEVSACLPDVADLNAALGRFGGDKFSATQLMFGGGGYALISNVLVGGSGWVGDQSVVSESLNLRCRLTVSGGAFEVGYSVLSIPHFSVIPAIGIGGAGYDVTLEPLNGDLRNFDSLLLNPGRTSTMSFSRFTVCPELMLNVPISWVGLYVKGGYALSFGTPEWKLGDGGRLLSGPAVAAGTPFVRLGISLGGFERRPRKGAGRAKQPPPLPERDDAGGDEPDDD